MSRYIGSTATVQPTQASTGGVYTLKDQLVYNTREQWPVARDPYFNYTTLLLQGDVPYTRGRGAMNLPLAYNSDASSNNFLITPNGDVGPRPFSPYFGGNYSVLFNGSTTCVQAGVASDWTFLTNTTAAWTIEMWIYPTSTSVGIILDNNNYNSASTGFNMSYGNGSISVQICRSVGSSYVVTFTSASKLTVNAWNNVVITYDQSLSSQNLKFYLNGTGLETANKTGNTPSGSTAPNTLTIGRYSSLTGIGDYFAGYIGNLRISNVVRVPSGLPTQPYANDANTKLLTCQSNRFIDNSSNNYTITTTSSPIITDNSPFVSTDTTTGAGYFNGSSYLTTPASNIFDFAAGQAFTFECWFYCTATGSQVITQGGANTFSLDVTPSPAGINYGKSGVANIISVAPSNFTANAWMHIVICRNTSNQSRMWLNGISVGSSNSDNYAFNNAVQYIGSTSNPGAYLNGYISGLRVLKGTAVYDPTSSSNITIPTVPPTPITNTSLCTLLTRAPSQNINFIDSSPNEFIVTKNGNTTQGTFSPFSPTGWGNQFNGSNNGFTVPASSAFSFAGEFTWEAFVCLNSIPSSGTAAFICSSRNTTASNSSFQFGIYNRPSVGTEVNVTISTGSTDYGLGWTITTPTIGVWYHVAVVRNSSNVVSCYWDGSLKTLTTGSSSAPGTTNTPTVVVSVGYRGTPNNDLYFNGYISNLRMIAAAMYSGSSITIPTAPFSPTVANTRFLTCQSNRFAETAAGMAITLTNSPSVQAFSPFAPANAVSPLVTGGSGYFDGGASSSADYLTWTGTAAGAGAFSYEFWVYSTNGFATMRAPLGVIAISGYNSALDIRMSGSTINASQYNVTSNNFTVETLQANTWYHVVICRNTSNQMTVFLNGTRSSTGALTISTNFSGLTSAIGRLDPNNGGDVTGYITGVRLVVGSTPYDPTQTTIPVPTTPPTAVPNTSLLLNFTNGAAVDATGKNNLESVGKAQNSGVQAKWDPLRGGSSLQFDGTGYLQALSTNVLQFGSSNFTVECWINLSSLASTYYCIASQRTGDTVPTIGWAFYINASKVSADFSNGTSNITNTNNTTLSTGVWYHAAMVRSGPNLTVYVNGVGSTPSPGSGSVVNTGSLVYVGFASGSAIGAFNGYISNLRITKGIARYTTNFNTNLPTAPFPRG